MQRKPIAALAFILALAPRIASAHPGLGHVHDAIDGFLHPLGGFDHVLAMVAVGVFAAQLGGRALWLVSAAFVTAMAAAGALGMAGIPLPYTEIGIALSIVALGLAVALRLHLPTAVAMAIAGVFAVFHGYAHGAEMPPTLSGLGYGLGFVAATALLHAAGIGGFLLLTRPAGFGQVAVRLLGGAAACIGAMLLIGAA